MPSRYENFSNAIVEALACGIPFLASDVGGNRLLAAEECGHLFQQESQDSLTSCLQKLMADRATLKSNGAFGVGYVKAHYSWAASAERLEHILTSRLGVKG